MTRDHSEPGGGGDAALARFASTAGLDLEEREYSLSSSSAVIAMSDGCYAYMSPYRLLLLLIQEMKFARNVEEWIESIKTKISAKAGDDSSFAISFGEGGFEALRERVADVYSELEPLMYVPEGTKPNRYVLAHHANLFEELFDENERRKLAASTAPLISSKLTADDTPVLLEVVKEDSGIASESAPKVASEKDSDPKSEN